MTSSRALLFRLDEVRKGSSRERRKRGVGGCHGDDLCKLHAPVRTRLLAIVGFERVTRENDRLLRDSGLGLATTEPSAGTRSSFVLESADRGLVPRAPK